MGLGCEGRDVSHTSVVEQMVSEAPWDPGVQQPWGWSQEAEMACLEAMTQMHTRKKTLEFIIQPTT